MQYPNIRKGISKLYLGEILVLLGAFLSLCLLVLLAVNRVDIHGTGEAFMTEIRSSGMLVAFAAYTIGTVLFALVGAILCLAGLTQAAHDEENFKKALWVVLAGIVISVAGSYLSQKNATVGKWIEVLSTICSMMSTLLVLAGIGEIAEGLGNQEVFDLSRSTSRIVLYPFILSMVAEVLVALLSLNESAAALFAIAISILDVVSYVFYLRALSRAKAMLR